MDELPSGIVTFVLTDVVGSTRLWQDAAADMDGAIARHAELITKAVEAHGGTVLKARGEGDSTFCVFGKATDAIAASHEAQVALRAEPWPAAVALAVRFALHTGEAVERDGDFLGPVVNRAARLRSIARGGEVLLTGTTASLVLDALPDGVALLEVGDVQLRDLDRAEHVYALDAPGLVVPMPNEPRATLVGSPQIDVRVLGGVQVLIDGEPIDIGGPKERAVLALLALAGGPLTHDRLVDDLWDGAPPASARKTLQTYIWRLRRVLTDDVLVSVTAGYELRLVAESDAARFGRLAQEGVAWVERNEPARGAPLLAQALGLWRGDPLAGCAPSPALDAHRARLQELRATTTERRLDSELRMGRHAEVIGDLERSVREDPYREERWRMLILAMYRCGRQRDALNTYQRARTALIDGLGIEPGPALKDLEQAILEQRPEIAAPQPREDALTSSADRASGAMTSPPVPSTRLIGRQAEQAALASLIDTHRLVTLAGVGGVGKTRLALAVAEAVRGRPVAFCDLSLLSRDGSVLHALARAVGQPMERHLLAAQGQPDLLEGLIQHVSDRGLLLIVDNCEHVLQPCSEIVGRVLAECRDITLVATSREPLGVPGEQVVSIPPLDPPANDADVTASSVKLFEQRAAAACPGFTVGPSNQSAVTEICRRLEGHPLALELAAARLSHLAPGELASRLEHPLQVLTARQHSGPERHRTLQATLDWSYVLLQPAEQILFRRLAVFAARFDLRDIEACCMVDDDGTDALDLVRALVDCSLVVAERTDTATRYRMLDTIRTYARDKLAASTDEDDIRAAHCRWHLARIEGISWGERILTLGGMQQLAEVHEDLRRALVWAESTGHHDLVARLVASMVGLWKEGHFAEADRWMPVAVDHEATQPPSERIATALSSTMYIFRWDGDHDALRRHRQRLAALVENLPADHPVTSLAYSTLASICSRLAGEEAAWEAYAELALVRAPADSAPLQAMARCQKARALMFRGAHRQAIELLEQGVGALDAEGFQFFPQEDLALAYHLTGEHERALSIAESRLSRTKPLLAWYVAIYAGLAAAALGDSTRARIHLRAASERVQAIRMPLALNDCRVAVGAMALLEGRLQSAIELLAPLGTGSTSFNTLGVLLQHYQERARTAVTANDWQRAQAGRDEMDAWSLIEAELGPDRC